MLPIDSRRMDQTPRGVSTETNKRRTQRRECQAKAGEAGRREARWGVEVRGVGGLNQSAIQEHEWNTPVELTFPRQTPLPSKRSRWKIEPKRKPSAPYSLPPSLKAFFFLFFDAIMEEWQHLMLLSHLRSFGVFQKRLWQWRSECARCNSVGFKKKKKSDPPLQHDRIRLFGLGWKPN